MGGVQSSAESGYDRRDSAHFAATARRSALPLRRAGFVNDLLTN